MSPASYAPATLAALIAWLAPIGVAPPARAQAVSTPPALMIAPGPQDRVLVIAPHPDDETLCCAGVLQRARANGAATAIVWITAGDGFEFDAMLVEHTPWPRQADLRQLGAQRLGEASAAAAELGVAPAQQYFLGYPDRGIAALMSEFYQHPYRSSHTGLSAADYPQALSPHAAYTGSNLEHDLARVIDQFEPTLVLAAAPEDRNPDHNASGTLARRLLDQRGQLARLRYWIVHAPHWPQPRGYQPQRALSPPAVAATLHWESLPLSDEERAHKLAALDDHRSQMELMGWYLQSFVRANELFARAVN
jgi:LmbE family N-acetylglucosaminyl deacetylase